MEHIPGPFLFVIGFALGAGIMLLLCILAIASAARQKAHLEGENAELIRYGRSFRQRNGYDARGLIWNQNRAREWLDAQPAGATFHEHEPEYDKSRANRQRFTKLDLSNTAPKE